MATENWRFGAVTEDKKLPVRFLDSNNIAIPIDGLIGYGIELYHDSRVILKAGVGLEGFNPDYVQQLDETTIQISMPGSILPKTGGKITAVTTIVIPDTDLPGGIFTDHSEHVVHLYNAIRKNG